MTLKEYLDIFAINKKEFADRLGISRQSLYRFVNRTQPPSLETSIRIVELCEGMVTFADLVQDEDTVRGEDLI